MSLLDTIREMVKEELDERSLTKPEKRKLKGKEKGEEVYYATLTKRAKEEA